MPDVTKIAKGADALLDARKLREVSKRGVATSVSSPRAKKSDVSVSKDQAAAAAALAIEDAAYKPNITDRAVGITGSAVGAAGMLSFIAPAALKIFSKPFEWTGKLTKSNKISGVAASIRKPADYVTEKTFADLGEKMGVGKTVGKASQTMANGAAVVVEKADRVTGLAGRLQGRAIGKAHRRFLNAREHAGALELSAIPAKHREPFKVLHEHVTGASHVGELQPNFVSSMMEAGEHAGGGVATATKTATQTTVNLSEKISAARESLEAMGKKGSGVTKSQMKSAKRFVDEMDHMAGHLEHAGTMGSVGGYVRNAPKNIAKGNITHGVMNGAFIAGSGVSMVGDARDFKTQLHTLKEMYADMTGANVNKVSTFRVLVGRVPEPVRMARGRLLKILAVKESTDAAGMAVNIKQAIDHRFNGITAIAAFMLPDMIGKGVEGMVGDTALPAYASFKHAFLETKASGQSLPAEAYAEFIANVSPELHRRGGEHSRFTEEIAKQYATEGKAPEEVMKEIDNGKLMSRVHVIIDKTEKEKAAAVAQPAAQTSHTQRLEGNKKSEMPVVGAHTNKIAAENTANTDVVRT